MLIPTTKNTRTVTDLREGTIALLNQIQKIGPTFIFHRSMPKAVMLSIEEYTNLLEMVEDYLDALKAQELEENPEKGGITLEELRKQYGL